MSPEALGLEAGRVKLIPYTNQWARLFEIEKARLLGAAADHLLDVQHVGSTSIPGLIAKPIIDICAAVESFEAARGCIESIERLGYSYRGEHGIPRRHYFVKGKPRTHHLHVVERDSRDWEITLLFRDHLIQHPSKLRQYAALKAKLAARFARDRKAYQQGKAAFIEAVLESCGPGPSGA